MVTADGGSYLIIHNLNESQRSRLDETLRLIYFDDQYSVATPPFHFTGDWKSGIIHKQ